LSKNNLGDGAGRAGVDLGFSASMSASKSAALGMLLRIGRHRDLDVGDGAFLMPATRESAERLVAVRMGLK
jgi:hypothetical protein